MIAGLLAAAAAVAQPQPALADLKLCNQTSYVIYTAIGAATKTELDVRGWTRVEPGDCATPISDALKATAYFMYARASQGYSGIQRAWGGGVQICARDTNFSVRMKLPVKACPGGEFYKMPFAVIDRHSRSSWTTTFTESDDIKSLKEAKRAGINRLLESLGYHVNVPGERARDLAIEDFHKRLKLPADASDSDLFDAMETQALKGAAPSGYTICNDSNEMLWAAVGLPKGRNLVSRGWWQIETGACSRVLGEPLKADHVYLFVQGKSKVPIVSGPAKLCTARNEFEISEKDRCSGRGLSKVGFAQTDTKGRSGYVVNVGETGILPPVPHATHAGLAAK